MTRKVLVARGGAVSPASGLGRAHADLISALGSGEIQGFTLSAVHEHGLGGNPIKRLLRRWRSHPSSLADLVRAKAASADCDLLHISDQEQAHLVPENCPVPVVVTVHDLFHLDPTIIETPLGPVTVGDTNPGMIRKRDLKKLKAGLARADLLVCDSRTTQEHAKRLFPNTKTLTVPLGLNCEERDPRINLKERPSSFVAGHKHLLVIGSEEPRKRLGFAIDVIAALPEKDRAGVILHKIGAESSPAARRRLTDRASSAGVKLNWLGALSEQELIAAEQHASALLFPSVAEGFGYPPLQAMAAGCPVLMSDLGSHNELAVPGTPLPPFDEQAWVEAVSTLNPIEGEAGLARAKEFSNSRFATAMSAAFSSLF